MRSDSVGVVGCGFLLAIAVLAVVSTTATHAEVRSGRAARQAGHSEALTEAVLPGVSVQCTDIETGSAFLYLAQHLFASGPIDQQWTPDSSEHCLGSSNGYRGRRISDGIGGEYFSWVDSRAGEADIYIQHLTASGDTCPGWSRGGRPTCNTPGSRYNLDAASDRQGGMLLAWQDFRSGQHSVVYCGRVSVDGSVASGWDDCGVALGNGAVDQLTPRVTADASGGAFVFWLEREGWSLALRAQHLNSNGAVMAGWPEEGVRLLPASHHVAGISAIADTGGAVDLFWRSSPDSNGQVLRVGRLAAGVAPDSSWGVNGTVLSSSPGASSDPVLVRSDDGGIFAAWSEVSGTGNALKLGRFTGAGGVASGWPQAGVVVAGTGVGISPPALLTDGDGGAIVAWEDRQSGSGHITAQRVLADGTRAPTWGEGTLVCGAGGEEHGPMLAPDGNGGVIVTWIDDETGGAAAFASSGTISRDALPTFLRAETNAGYARLVWDVPTALNATLHAYRQEKDIWESLTQVATTDDISHFVIEDRTAPAGTYVRYRLSVEGVGDELFLAPISVLILPATGSAGSSWSRSTPSARAVPTAIATISLAGCTA